MAFAWISSKTFSVFTSQSSNYSYYPCKYPSSSNGVQCCKCELPAESNEFKLVLHDALDSSGINTSHARVARDEFYSQIKKLSRIERETSISISRGIDLGRAALNIAAEDDSLISHSSVPLPVEDFIERLDNLSIGYCSRYSSSFRSSPENFLDCLERYLYINEGFRRTSARNQIDQRALYLNSVLTHRSGSVSLLSLIYSEILKMLRLWGILNFDAEVFFPHDSYSSPRGFQKQESKERDLSHVISSQSLLVQILKDLKHAFWPFQLDRARSPFLRAAQAANCFDGSYNTKESALELVSAKAARHKLQRGVWTSVRFGNIRRALSACERLILLTSDPEEIRDYAILLYHCGFYKESLQYLKQYQDTKSKISCTFEKQSYSTKDLEDEAVQKLVVRVNLILMEEGWSIGSHNPSVLCCSDPW